MFKVHGFVINPNYSSTIINSGKEAGISRENVSFYLWFTPFWLHPTFGLTAAKSSFSCAHQQPLVWVNENRD
jgi:hypothetical protein